MMLVLSMCAAVALVELCLWLPGLWRSRRFLAECVALATGLTTAFLLVADFSAWQWLLAVLSGYRIFNLLRVYKGHIHPDYLFHSARRSSLWLIGAQAGVIGLASVVHRLELTVSGTALVVALIGLVGSGVLLASTLRHRRTTKPPVLDTGLASRDLPSLTVAIPARNETTDLEACLQSLLASTYPKLEILVLDDCSQNTRTPEIIRAFAHDGVRFMAGSPPPDRWLAKNYAYEQLSNEANGEYILFCGVDARFEATSLHAIVETMLVKQKTMLSIMPVNIRASAQPLLSLLVQTGRYAWELALPRRWLERPPVLSTTWIIKASTLEAAGGLNAVCRSILPERYLARYAASHDDGYSFVASNEQLGVRSVKGFAEQQATAVRTRYPALHRCPERVAAVGLVQVTVLLAPLYCLVVGLAKQEWPLVGIAAAAYLAAISMYNIIYTLTYRTPTLQGFWLLPLAVVYDIGLLHYSMYRYEFSEVIWKGRNVCVPVMHVIPRLPKLN